MSGEFSNINTEQLARLVAENTSQMAEEVNARGKDWMVPPPPKPGELMYCIWCGKAMYPEDFSKDPKIRRYEFKWHIHYTCQQKAFDEADRTTPGLLASKKNHDALRKPVSMSRAANRNQHQ